MLLASWGGLIKAATTQSEGQVLRGGAGEHKTAQQQRANVG